VTISLVPCGSEVVMEVPGWMCEREAIVRVPTCLICAFKPRPSDWELKLSRVREGVMTGTTGAIGATGTAGAAIAALASMPSTRSMMQWLGEGRNGE
jgi:hypothetical protein